MALDRRAFLASGAVLGTASLLETGTGMAQEGATVPAKPVILRRFVEVEGRQIAYFRCGKGPPLVLLHAYPGSAMMMIRHMERHADRNSCFVFETPGMGYSDPLPGGVHDAADVAETIAAAMRALALPPAVLFGIHSGAVVATEIASRHPDLVCGLVTDGLPLIEEASHSAEFAGYFRPFVPDAEGTHFTWAWSRFRDQFIFYPWNDRRRDAMRDDVVGFIEKPIGLHQTVMAMALGPDYVDVYRSAVFYGKRGVSAVERVTAPATFLEGVDDVTHSLELMPPLRANQQKYLTPDEPTKAKRVSDSIRQFSGSALPPVDKNPLVPANILRRHVVSLPGHDMLVRHIGTAAGRPLLLLHDAPGSAKALEPLIRAVGQRRRVIASDLPGCGGSDPLPAPSPPLSAFADALQAACAVLKLGKVDVHGCGFGSSLAAELAVRHPALVGRLHLQGALLPDPMDRQDMQARYTPPITIGRDGSHWYATWLMLRDSELFWPWYRTDKAHMRKADVDLDAWRLHDWTVEVMRQAGGYPQLPQAALGHDLAGTLRMLDPGSITILRDPGHRMAVYQDRLAALLPKSQIIDLPSRSLADILSA